MVYRDIHDCYCSIDIYAGVSTSESGPKAQNHQRHQPETVHGLLDLDWRTRGLSVILLKQEEILSTF